MFTRSLGREMLKRVAGHPSMIPQMGHVRNEVKYANMFTKRSVSFSRIHLTHYLEDYYTSAEIATNMVSPMSEYVWWSWLFLQASIVFGTLFHSNYYFTGKALPKVQGNSQLCEDSW
ncbi:hypothetical protein C922_03392 [Plasmodium inui San Antonio 1]|uniref:Uncharacterized protein n=1 Tax=Plasmodium inui San Antonio 1 TaxID=1237626 RepID=W6ZZ79_9APIC|nr:hypothetical protein C922_03392 [Plasmodium inui San Antonio 1]EUD66197.1 hypothetical protein C922_03392 [Plasmodium inui San Antonio 1]